MKAGNPETPYSMVIEWDPDDQIFVVTVPELPGCRTHGRTYEEAIVDLENWATSHNQTARPAVEEHIVSTDLALPVSGS